MHSHLCGVGFPPLDYKFSRPEMMLRDFSILKRIQDKENQNSTFFLNRLYNGRALSEYV